MIRRPRRLLFVVGDHWLRRLSTKRGGSLRAGFVDYPNVIAGELQVLSSAVFDFTGHSLAVADLVLTRMALSREK